MVEVAGIDHVGIGTDYGAGYRLPEGVPTDRPGFDWVGFRPEHRTGPRYRVAGYATWADWPNLTVHLAKRGFGAEDLRKIIGLNFLQVFYSAVG